MAVVERDPHIGYLTTGHEWNGIKELNTPVPRPVYVFLAVTALFAVVYWILMPAWPTGTGYTKGLLAADQRDSVSASLKAAAAERAVWMRRVETEEFATIRQDHMLMNKVRQTGRSLFGDNCAACHGSDAKGGKGFPDLTAASALWGSDPETLAETIRVGVNSGHPDGRVSQMPAFGSGGILSRREVEEVVAYVGALSRPETAGAAMPAKAAAGRAVFAANCAACHGEDGRGSAETGAPNLTDASWLYGSDPETIRATVWGGRQGHMPSWEARLSAAERRLLALYVSTLKEKAP